MITHTSKLTNSTIGSSHWFNSLIATMKDAATYAEKADADPEKVRKYARQSLDAANELLRNRLLLTYVSAH